MVSNGFRQIFTAFKYPKFPYALLCWPKFSMTSFLMVSRLIEQGILPNTVIDVGANIGQFTVASSKLLRDTEVHSFEPVPELLRVLTANATRLRGVTVYPFALGDHEGELSFNVNVHSQSSSALRISEEHLKAFPEARETKTIAVKMTTLDQVLGSVKLRPPVLLKIDVQGYESHVLRGAAQTLKRTEYVLLETSFKPMYEGEVIFRDILELMEDVGFRFLRPVGWLSAPNTDEVLQMDGLFIRDNQPI